MSEPVSAIDALPGASSEPQSLPQPCDATLRAMIAASPYADLLQPIVTDICRIATSNTQIRAALERAATSGRVPRARWPRFSAPDADERTLLSYLEYMAFASPRFLQSVGEWPRGRA